MIPLRMLCLCVKYLDRVTRVKHHKKKIAFLFSAMRHFAKELREKNYKVDLLN